jgi:hypothetical protein
MSAKEGMSAYRATLHKILLTNIIASSLMVSHEQLYKPRDWMRCLQSDNKNWNMLSSFKLMMGFLYLG